MYQRTVSRTSKARYWAILPQPALAWTAIFALVLVTAGGIVAGAGSSLNFIFPAMAVAVGLLLYWRYPILYIGFTWWIFCLSPLVRRLSDYYSGIYSDPSTILLAPYLVALITLITLWYHLPQTYRQGNSGGLPFLLCFAATLYGGVTGLILNAPQLAIKEMLEWLTPLAFGFHLYVNWQHYPSYRQNIQRIAAWTVLVMGIYGVIQYCVAPEWDVFWLENTRLLSQGEPRPFGLRVWSTLNSVEPFSGVMAASLILLLTHKGPFNVAASVVGYLSLLLSISRSAWLGWLAGVLLLTGSLKAKFQVWLMISILSLSILVIPLAKVEPFSAMIVPRLETLSNISQDDSAQARKITYAGFLEQALSSFEGSGMGNQISYFDSAILTFFFSLGWFGTLLFGSGMLLLLLRLFQASEASFDLFKTAAPAIVMSNLVRFPLNVPMLGASGLVFWAFISLGLAAEKYYRHQRTLGSAQSLLRHPPKT